MDRIGLQATGQQEILSNCHDVYSIEMREVGSDAWRRAGFRPFPAPVAARLVNEMNSEGDFVFRCVLVGVAQ